MNHITSHQNPKIKQIRALGKRKERAAQGLCVVEGIHHIGEAVEAGASIEYALFAPELLTSGYAYTLLANLADTNVECLTTTPEIFSTIANKENPQGFLAVVKWHPTPLARLSPEIFPWGVALVSPQDPGNVGTILRSIDAFGASGLILLGDSTDPVHPTAIRASMGALFWYPVTQVSFPEFATWSKQNRYRIYGSSAHGSQEINAITKFESPVILLLGSERAGLTEEQIAVCDSLIRLPMYGRATSLNLSVAAGILLYEMSQKLV